MADAQNHVRPTEAQLRWAGFHFKSRASRVKVAVEKFYQQPVNVRDVEGTFSEDGNTTEESASTTDEQHGRSTRRSKPKISRGRRALLRVSKRKFQKRREEIEKRGYGGERLGSDNEDGALEAIFAEEVIQKRRRKRRRNYRSAKEADQVRRFEAAFHSMMKNLEASQQPRHVIETPTKIWTRPEGAQPMESLDYSAMKLLGSHQKVHNPYNARWSFYYNLPLERSDGQPHVPSSEEMHSHPQSSPMHKGYKDLVTEFQHRVRSPQLRLEDMNINAPSMKLSKYFLPADLEDDEDDDDDNNMLENKKPISGNMVRARSAALNRQQTQEQLDNVIHSIDPQLLKEMEDLDPGVTERLRALYLGEESPHVDVKAVAKRIESPNETKNSKEGGGGFVQKFVAYIEEEIRRRKEDLVAADGKLHKAAFAKLVNQYLLEVGALKHGPKGSSASSQMYDSSKVAALAHEITAKLNGTDGRKDDSVFVDSQGTFDKQAFGDLVTRYLSEATGIDEKVVRQVEDFESLTCLPLHDGQALQDREENNNHIQSISNQLAIDFCSEIQPLIRDPSTLPFDQIPSKLEEITKHFLIQHCGVQPEEYLKLPREEPALFRTVASLQNSALSAFRSSQRGNYNGTEFQTRVCSHFVRFFEASLASAGPEEDETFVKMRVRRSALVEDLIAHIQQAAAVEHLANSEGKLDMSIIAKLIQRYLAASSQQDDDGSYLRQAHSPLALAQMRRMAGSRRNRRDDDNLQEEQLPMEPIDLEESSRFVAMCVKDLESKSRGEIFVTADGGIDEVKLGQLLRRSFNPNYFALPGEHALNGGIESFDDQQHGHEDRLTARSVVSDLTHGSHDAANTAGGNLASKPVGTIVKSVSKSIGGLVRRLYKGDENNELEEMRAYSAFRTIKNAQSDDASTHASFFLEGINAGLSKLGNRSKQSGGQVALSNAGSPQGKVNSALMSKNGQLLSSLLDTKISDRSIIDTDGQSDVGSSSLRQDRIKQLLLSPAIITKRHRQAIRSIENRQWQEVQYLISANPWLAEMSDANTKQYLLHKLALYGAGEVVRGEGGQFETQAAAPFEVNIGMVRLFPSSVHKFDQEGNLPLHMAAASANVSMVQLLGDRFPSGATVRNEDGLLPLHLALLACASPRTAGYGDPETVRELVHTIFGYFPGAVAVTDNEGNLPIHTAASVLKGHVGVEAIFMLFDEAERQLQDPRGVRFRNKLKLEELENMSIDTEATETPTDSSTNLDDALQCTMIRNDLGETPLLCAIHSNARWEVIDALVQGPCGNQSCLLVDENGNNALHLLLDNKYQDPTSALSVLKVAPEAACARNHDGMLPIELACMHSLPIEVIMALVLVDLPIDIDNKDAPERRPGFGESWWFIACDCDDHYTEVVDEIVGICSVAQVRELAYMENSAGESLISRAAPESKEILQCSLRFLGRFEIKSEMPVPESSAPDGITLFEALDFGYPDDAIPDGIDVFLKFFPDRMLYDAETIAVRQLEFDFSLVEEVFAFDISGFGDEVFDETKQFCLCIERPQLTLAGVVSGMIRNKDCQNDPKTRKRYASKALAVLKAVAKSLDHLHSLGVVHGNLSVDNIGKYENSWKLAGISGVQRIGEPFDSSRFSFAVPPEAISPVQKLGQTAHKASFRDDLITCDSIDSWGFGKLAYEVLVGKPLVAFDDLNDFQQNHDALMDIMHWNEFNVEALREDLLNVGVSAAAVDLIEACLAAEPSSRPSFASIVEHDVWREVRRF
ncbi:hypothetical protein ACA910_017184 [Epithemia clementina (nom. ined.)]